jgi:hypothetical protein
VSIDYINEKVLIRDDIDLNAVESKKGGLVTDYYRLRFLTGRRLRIFLQIADCIVPPDAAVQGAGTPATAGVVDWALGRMPIALRAQFLSLFMVVEILGFFFGGKPFTRNKTATQIRQLKWMESGPFRFLRVGFFGLKTYVCMGYYCREDVWPQIHYQGPLEAGRPYSDPIIRALCQKRIEVRP